MTLANIARVSITIGRWTLTNFGIVTDGKLRLYYRSDRRRGSSTETMEVVWPKVKHPPLMIKSKAERLAEGDYVMGKITLKKLNQIRKDNPKESTIP